MKKIALLLVLLPLAASAGAQVKEKAGVDRARGLNWVRFEAKPVTVKQGKMRWQRVKWEITPVLNIQTTDPTKRTAWVVLEVSGISNAFYAENTFTYTRFVVVVDGAPVNGIGNEFAEDHTQPGAINWTVYGGMGYPWEKAMPTVLPETLRRIAGGREVFFTILLDNRQYSVQLSDDQLAAFRALAARFGAKEGKTQ